jgi:hypothetical protein
MSGKPLEATRFKRPKLGRLWPDSGTAKGSPAALARARASDAKLVDVDHAGSLHISPDTPPCAEAHSVGTYPT